MENKIFSALVGSSNTVPVSIFGYSTHGLPGLEIIGLGQHGRSIKEKFIYLSRLKKLQIPMRKYVLCIESKGLTRAITALESINLECPMLICFWSLAGIIKFHHLDDCLSIGQVNISGKVKHVPLNSVAQKKIIELLKYEGIKKIKWITDNDKNISEENIYFLDANEILDVFKN